MGTLPDNLREATAELLLSMADDKLFLGHRNGDWTGLGPSLEEDIAFSNIAQDEIAHAQELYRLVADLRDPGADRRVLANHLAYARPADERLNAVLVERADAYDWGIAITRQFFFDRFDLARLPRLQRSCHQPLADLSGKMLQEVNFHADHFDGWMIRLGQGTSESRERLQSAVETLWADALGLFEPLVQQDRLISEGVFPDAGARMMDEWREGVSGVLREAGLSPTQDAEPRFGGRRGQHGPELEEMLADLSEVYRYEPDAAW